MSEAVSPARRWGYRVLGDAMPYLLHLRPAEWPVMAGHTALGWLLAVGFARPQAGDWLGLLLWVVALNGGTLALNSAFDQDEGDIAYLRQPPQPPAALAGAAMMLMLLGLAASWWLPTTFRWLYLAALLMSVAYSVPPFRLKRIGGADWVINMIGFGSLTPWAGWSLSGRELDLEHALLLAAFCPLFAALYPLTQLYQMSEDAARGDRTLVLLIGPRAALTAAIGLTTLAFGMIGLAAAQAGWAEQAVLRGGLVALAGAAWFAVLVPWRRQVSVWTADQHQRGMYHALMAWALTDAAVVLAWRL